MLIVLVICAHRVSHHVPQRYWCCVICFHRVCLDRSFAVLVTCVRTPIVLCFMFLLMVFQCFMDLRFIRSDVLIWCFIIISIIFNYAAAHHSPHIKCSNIKWACTSDDGMSCCSKHVCVMYTCKRVHVRAIHRQVECGCMSFSCGFVPCSCLYRVFLLSKLFEYIA